MKYDVFISYSRKDKSLVSEFCKLLSRNEISYWLDNREIKNGDEFKTVIVKAIEQSTVFVFISSINSNASEWTSKEIGIAVARGKYIIPIRLDNSSYNKAVEFDLINIDFVDYSNKSTREKSENRLMATIKNKCLDINNDIKHEVVAHKSSFAYLKYFIIGLIPLFVCVIIWKESKSEPKSSLEPKDDFQYAKNLLESDDTDSVKLGYDLMLDLANNGESRAKIEIGITNFASTERKYTTNYIIARRNHLGLKDGNRMEYDNVINNFTTVTDSTVFSPESFYILGVVYFNIGKRDSALYAFKKGEELLDKGKVAAHGYITSDLRKRIKNNIKQFED